VDVAIDDVGDDVAGLLGAQAIGGERERVQRRAAHARERRRLLPRRLVAGEARLEQRAHRLVDGGEARLQRRAAHASLAEVARAAACIASTTKPGRARYAAYIASRGASVKPR